MPNSNNYRVICRALVSRCIISAQYITSLNHSSGITLRDIVERARALSKYKALKGTLSAYQISSITVVGVGIAIVILALAVLRCFLAGQRNGKESRNRQAELRNLRKVLKELQNRNSTTAETTLWANWQKKRRSQSRQNFFLTQMNFWISHYILYKHICLLYFIIFIIILSYIIIHTSIIFTFITLYNLIEKLHWCSRTTAHA